MLTLEEVCEVYTKHTGNNGIRAIYYNGRDGQYIIDNSFIVNERTGDVKVLDVKEFADTLLSNYALSDREVINVPIPNKYRLGEPVFCASTFHKKHIHLPLTVEEVCDKALQHTTLSYIWSLQYHKKSGTYVINNEVIVNKFSGDVTEGFVAYGEEPDGTIGYESVPIPPQYMNYGILGNIAKIQGNPYVKCESMIKEEKKGMKIAKKILAGVGIFALCTFSCLVALAINESVSGA